MGIHFNLLSCTYPCCFGQLRYMMVAMSVIAIIVTHCQRTVLNIGIVEMVGKERVGSTCPIQENIAQVIQNISGGKVDWGEHEQNLNLASFFIGYVVLQVPSGILCDMYGARHFVICGTFLSTITTAAIPWATMYLQWWVVFILRIFTGFGQSVLYPGLSSLIGRWIPNNERSSVGAIVFASNSFGLIIGNVGTGLLIKRTEDWRWPYYVWTLCGILFVCTALMYIFSDPSTHPYVTKIEMDYLNAMVVTRQPMKIPFLKIITDKCVIGLLVGQLGHDLVMFTLANNLPKYLNNVMGFDIETNALISLIYLFQWFSSFVFGKLADYMISRNANITWMRKIYTILSVIVSGLSLLGAALAKCDRFWVVALFAKATFWNGLYYCGLKVHIIDISVNNTAMVMSFVNGFGAISGFACSFLIGEMANDNTHEQWRNVMLLILGLDVLSMVFYTILTKTDRRSWDYLPGEEPLTKKKPNKWYLELTPSDYALRIDKERTAEEAARAAKARMKASLRGSRSDNLGEPSPR